MAKKLTAFEKRDIAKKAARLLGNEASPERLAKLENSYARGGASGFLNQINSQRKTQGLAAISGKVRNLADVRDLQPFVERFAYESGRNAKVPTFDEGKAKGEIEAEFTPYFNEETEEQGTTYSRVNEDLLSEQADQERGITRNIADYARNEQDLAQERLFADRNRQLTQEEENRGQTRSLAGRGVSTSSPAYQRLQERLSTFQSEREKQQNAGFDNRRRDQMTNRSRYDENVATARQQIGQRFARNTQDRGFFDRRRRRELQEKIGLELDGQRNQELGTTNTY